ncbi:MFS transporter [Leekyejoonella antrihumi]|uniref:MFS transporter n=1 Tax=Leekyejoonella antrihumi TaxID=1660198 RepID=A0A563DTN9_9MICO|nr:MFS transporter [Leekyejoonella antrihumi]TWP33628.1 MFS transporter [Leekyejoonella antrihumi]
MSDVTSRQLAALDDARPNRFQLKIMFVSGMGFFTDAYDLFIIGVVVSLLKTQWHLSTDQVSLLNSATLVASAVGAIVFGRVADMVGRKKIYGYEVLVLAAGALASAFAPTYALLLVFRIVLGIGIGGDYPVSATIMSEYSGKASRGRMVGLVFAMQGAGLVFGPMLASTLLASGLSSNLIWRLLLAFGAIPGLAVFYLRRQIQETPRFAMAGGVVEEAEAAIALATGQVPAPVPTRESSVRITGGAVSGVRVLFSSRRMMRWLFGTAVGWMLLDFAYYGNSISSPAVLKLLSPNASLLQNTLLQLGIFALFALPGYALAVLLMDRLGRKTIQLFGFGMMALAFLLIAAVPSVAHTAGPFVLLYGMSYLFSEFGPNTTTFVFPAEVFPVQVRTTGHGISAAAGKLGAFAGAYLFPQMLASSMGIRGAELVAGVVSIVGLIVTAVCLPEPKGRSLEDLTELALEGAAPQLVAA